MRKTVDLDIDTEQMIRHRMATRGVTFEQAVNDSIRLGFDRGGPWQPYHARTASMGAPKVNPGATPRPGAEPSNETARRLS